LGGAGGWFCGFFWGWGGCGGGGGGGGVWEAVCWERQRDAPKAAARCSAVKPSPDTCTHSVEGLGFRV